MPRRDRLWQSLVIGRQPVRTLVRVAVLLVVGTALYLTLKFILTPLRVVGISMEQTCRSGEIKWLNRLAYRWSTPKRGDVVAVQGNDRRFLYLKRVVELPEETVCITNGVVVINGVPLAEAYLSESREWNVPPLRLGENQYLVIGDNRAMDQVIHDFGAVERCQIAGHVLGVE